MAVSKGKKMFIYSKVTSGLLFIESDSKMDSLTILNKSGQQVNCPVLSETEENGAWKYMLAGGNLMPWSPETPVLYTLAESGLRFGYCELRPFQNKELLLNGSPVYLRGYIRGITAHDHPNMTGGTIRDAALKNISQAKKYGFNLVRFHSTIPTEEFVNAADELGLLIHLEIGFAYDYDEHGNKKNLSMNNTAWRESILKFRNHPSVAIFCIGNEMHNSGHFKEVRAMYDEGRALAPNKLIMDNSGWGEYDRDTADVYCQHIAYFFPFKHHAGMFESDAPWRMNGSAYDAPLNDSRDTESCTVTAYRVATPARPTLSHEALHYIDIPDYDALAKKFDDFAEKAGREYLEANKITKPRFMTELPALIRQKGLEKKMPDYIAGSRQFKKLSYKIFLEKLRFSHLRGFEMLQLSDCLKYENKNGIIDCFDDDKYIDPAWMKQFNDDFALLAAMKDEAFCYGTPIDVEIAVSDFLPEPEIMGRLEVLLDGECVYSGSDFRLPGGFQTLVKLTLTPKQAKAARCAVLKAIFTTDNRTFTNQWLLWLYPEISCCGSAMRRLHSLDLPVANDPESNTVVTDALDEAVMRDLETGKNVILFYSKDAPRNKWQLPATLERFKPCIWDRGSNLGGIIYSESLRKALASNRYFDINMQPLLEAGCKINLDHFPERVNEIICGIDKPVRDRMKGLIFKIKDFLPDDTLRNFSHLFSIRVGNVGKGLLTICTFNMYRTDNPVVRSLLEWLLAAPCETDRAISMKNLKAYLDDVNSAPLPIEDTMNHFWEIDNKPVEDKLFWEEAKIDMSKHRD